MRMSIGRAAPVFLREEELRTQLVTRTKGTPTPTQLLQPPKPCTDELDEPKVNPPPPEPKPENPLLWAPKPDVCWDSDPKVGAF